MNDDELKATQAQAKKAPKLRVFQGERKSSTPQGWGLVMNEKGQPEPCLHNAAVLMVQAHEWGRRGLLSFDTFSSRVLVERARRFAISSSSCDQPKEVPQTQKSPESRRNLTWPAAPRTSMAP